MKKELTKLQRLLIRAKFKKNSDASEYFGYSYSAFSKLVSDNYNPSGRMKEWITTKLNERLQLYGKRKLSIADVF